MGGSAFLSYLLNLLSKDNCTLHGLLERLREECKQLWGNVF